MKLFDNVAVLASLVPATRTSDTTGTAVDTQGYENGMVVVSAGDIDLASADETYAFNVYECDTSGGTFTDTGITVSVTADNDVKVARIPELNVTRKRYLQVRLDVGGTTPSIPCSANFLLGGKVSGPVNTD